MDRQDSNDTEGFTIIEVLIVLAIAGVILLTIFLAVPALRRNERNYHRKHFVDITAAALDESYSVASLQYPNTPQEMCKFITNYLAKPGGGAGTCSPSYTGGKDCVLVQLLRYDVCYHNMDTSPHSYVGPEDEISVQLGHWCTPNPNPYRTDHGNPITAGDTQSLHEKQQYVVWTKLERAGIYCVDNYDGP